MPASAATIKWKGFDWKVTNGGMAGIADGVDGNVSIDGNGYLHLKIVKSGDEWTASELFTTQKLGFGTYQWLIDGPVDTFDKQVVLGLFPYGPAAGIGADATNEIDIEWARWGYADGTNVGFTNYPASGKVVGTKSFKVSLGGGTASTARFVWTHQSIESSVLKGYQPLGTNAGELAKWKYAPDNSGTNIPQEALPLGINLWCFEAPPSDGKSVEIVLRDFQFVKEGDPIPVPGEGGMGTGGNANGGAAGNGHGGAGGNASGGSGAGGATGGAAAGGNASGGNAAGGAAVSGASAGGSENGGSPSGAGTGPSGAGGNGAGAPVLAGGAGTGGAGTGGPASAMAGNGATEPVGEGGGCSCRVPRSTETRGALALSLALAAAVWRRRRAR